MYVPLLVFFSEAPDSKQSLTFQRDMVSSFPPVMYVARF